GTDLTRIAVSWRPWCGVPVPHRRRHGSRPGRPLRGRTALEDMQATVAPGPPWTAAPARGPSFRRRELGAAHLLGPRIAERSIALPERRIGEAEDRDGHERGVDRPRLADRQARDRNAARHLHRGQERIEAVERPR